MKSLKKIYNVMTKEKLWDERSIFYGYGKKWEVDSIVEINGKYEYTLIEQNTIPIEIMEKLKQFNTPIETLSGHALEVLKQTLKKSFSKTPTRL